MITKTMNEQEIIKALNLGHKEDEKTQCDCCGWDDNGYIHEPYCSSLTQ